MNIGGWVEIIKDNDIYNGRKGVVVRSYDYGVSHIYMVNFGDDYSFSYYENEVKDLKCKLNLGKRIVDGWIARLQLDFDNIRLDEIKCLLGDIRHDLFNSKERIEPDSHSIVNDIIKIIDMTDEKCTINEIKENINSIHQINKYIQWLKSSV